MSDLIKTLAALAWVSVLTAAFIAAVLVLTPIILKSAVRRILLDAALPAKASAHRLQSQTLSPHPPRRLAPNFVHLSAAAGPRAKPVDLVAFQAPNLLFAE